MHKYVAETLGTFLLVFIGTLTLTQSGGNAIIIACGFGIALFIVIGLFGSLSGAHVNPAVSFGAWFSGDLSTHDIVPYWVAQGIGATGASLLVLFIVGSGASIGETTFGSMAPRNALLLETALTFVFVSVVLAMSGGNRKNPAFVIAGTLIFIHLAAVPLTGASVNPIRSIAPVVVAANPQAATQLWVYVVGPLLGGDAGWATCKICALGQNGEVEH